MKKVDYIKMLREENTLEDTKDLYEEVIQSIELGLSSVPNDYEIQDTSLGLNELYKKIEDYATFNKRKSLSSIEAGKIFSEYFNVQVYDVPKKTNFVNLEDIF